MNKLKIKLKSAQLNLEEKDAFIEFHFALLDAALTVQDKITLAHHDDAAVFLTLDSASCYLLTSLYRNSQLMGSAQAKLDQFVNLALNELQLVSNHIVIGRLQIWFENPTRIIHQSQRLRSYLHETGLEVAFTVVFHEIMQKRLSHNEVFSYAATRIREIGIEYDAYKASLRTPLTPLQPRQQSPPQQPPPVETKDSQTQSDHPNEPNQPSSEQDTKQQQ